MKHNYVEYQDQWWVFASGTTLSKIANYLKSLGIPTKYTIRTATRAEVELYRLLYKNLIFETPKVVPPEVPPASGTVDGPIRVGTQFILLENMFVGSVNLLVNKGTILTVTQLPQKQPPEGQYICSIGGTPFISFVSAFNGMLRRN